MIETKTSEKSWSYNDYLKLSDDQRYEILTGKLIMVPAPDWKHQNISRIIQKYLYKIIDDKNIGRVYNAPFDVILDNQTIVQPDILLISQETLINYKGNKSRFEGIPELVIEIISPSSRSRDITDKRIIYEKFGVKEYWIVDPKYQSIDILSLDDSNKYILFSTASLEDERTDKVIVSKLIVDLELNLEEIFQDDFI